MSKKNFKNKFKRVKCKKKSNLHILFAAFKISPQSARIHEWTQVDSINKLNFTQPSAPHHSLFTKCIFPVHAIVCGFVALLSIALMMDVIAKLLNTHSATIKDAKMQSRQWRVSSIVPTKESVKEEDQSLRLESCLSRSMF